MKRIIRLTESDLTRIVKRVISEQDDDIVDNNLPVLMLLRAYFNGKYHPKFIKRRDRSPGKEIVVWEENIPREGKDWRLAVFLPPNIEKINLSFETSNERLYEDVKKIFEGMSSNKTTFGNAGKYFVKTSREYDPKNEHGVASGFDSLIKDTLNVCINFVDDSVG